MIVVDANLLVYARVATLPQHEAARHWLDRQLNSTTAVGLPWMSLLSFLRLVTNPRIFARADTLSNAWRQVRSGWIAGRSGFRGRRTSIARFWDHF